MIARAAQIDNTSAPIPNPGLGFLLEWVLSCSAFGIFIVLVVSLNGDIGALVCALGGGILGSLQALILRRYVGNQVAIRWVFVTSLGWFGAMVILFFGDFLTGVGSGLNNYDPRSDDIVVGLAAGAFLGIVQSMFVPELRPLAWIVLNALAWGLGTFVGGLIEFALNAKPDPYAMYALIFMSTGAVVATLVYGIVTGLGATYLLRARNPSGQSGGVTHQPRVKLYIMCGLPFAGKTTLARELARLLGFTYISMDEINTERGLGLGGERITPQQWTETYSEMYWRVRVALSRGETVVLDAPSFTREQRREVEEIGADYLVASRIIYVAVPETEARRRWQENRLSAGRHDVGDDDFELVARNFEPPDRSENPLVFDQSLAPEAWIRNTFSRAE